MTTFPKTWRFQGTLSGDSANPLTIQAPAAPGVTRVLTEVHASISTIPWVANSGAQSGTSVSLVVPGVGNSKIAMLAWKFAQTATGTAPVELDLTSNDTPQTFNDYPLTRSQLVTGASNGDSNSGLWTPAGGGSNLTLSVGNIGETVIEAQGFYANILDPQLVLNNPWGIQLGVFSNPSGPGPHISQIDLVDLNLIGNPNQALEVQILEGPGQGQQHYIQIAGYDL